MKLHLSDHSNDADPAGDTTPNPPVEDAPPGQDTPGDDKPIADPWTTEGSESGG